MDISNWVAQRADWSPDKIAIHFDGQDIPYAALEARVARLAGALRTLGIGAGARVAHLGYNAPEVLELLFACARTGAILVPLNWRLTPSEHAYMLSDCQPAAIFVEAEFQPAIAGIADQQPGLNLIALDTISADTPDPARWQDMAALVAAAAPLSPDLTRDLKVPVKIVYTSGTTGQPKGAVLTQEALFFNAVNAQQIFHMSADDHILTVLPLFHVGGMNIQTTPALHAGATVTLHRKFDPDLAMADLVRRRPSLLLSVPAVANALSSHRDFARADLSSLKCLCTGSSTVPQAVIDPWVARNVPVTQVYGMTESSPIAIALSIADGLTVKGSTGKPVTHCAAQVVDDNGAPVPVGTTGEIWLRGPNIMREYWQNPAATAAVFTDGWYHTGDLGHQDDAGYFYIDDRKKDVVISGGENIYPAELENVLADCPDMVEFAVIGRPDDKWGEVPVAVIVPAPDSQLDPARVAALFDGRLARYKHPRDVIFTAGPLPRTSLGKVRKFALRRQLFGDT